MVARERGAGPVRALSWSAERSLSVEPGTVR